MVYIETDEWCRSERGRLREKQRFTKRRKKRKREGKRGKKMEKERGKYVRNP